jgi:hypothetical protein
VGMGVWEHPKCVDLAVGSLILWGQGGVVWIYVFVYTAGCTKRRNSGIRLFFSICICAVELRY